MTEHFTVERLHALARQWAGVFDPLLSGAPEFRIDRRVVYVGSPGMQDAARPHPFEVFGALLPRIVELLRLFLSVEVVEVSKPLIEAMHRGQKFVAIA